MKEKLPIRTLLLWQLRLSVIAVLPIISLYLFSLLSNRYVLIGVWIWAILAVIFTFVYIPYFFKSYEISFKDGAIIINRGIIVKTTHIMPFSRLVYAQSFATPLAEKLGLAALTLKAARSSILIPELRANEVEKFLEFLTKEDAK